MPYIMKVYFRSACEAWLEILVALVILGVMAAPWILFIGRGG